MRALLLLATFALACSTPPSEPASPAAAPEAAAPAPEAAAPEAAAPAADAPSYPAADATWARVPLAAGAVSSAAAASEVPATFRNGAGQIACPVMGMAIAKPDDAVSYADHDGVRYFFCCDSCEKLFLDNPTAYANGKYLAKHDLDPTAAAACEDETKLEG